MSSKGRFTENSADGSQDNGLIYVRSLEEDLRTSQMVNQRLLLERQSRDLQFRKFELNAQLVLRPCISTLRNYSDSLQSVSDSIAHLGTLSSELRVQTDSANSLYTSQMLNTSTYLTGPFYGDLPSATSAGLGTYGASTAGARATPSVTPFLDGFSLGWPATPKDTRDPYQNIGRPEPFSARHRRSDSDKNVRVLSDALQIAVDEPRGDRSLKHTLSNDDIGSRKRSGSENTQHGSPKVDDRHLKKILGS